MRIAVLSDIHANLTALAYDADAEIELLLQSDDPFRTSTIATLRTGRYAP